MPRGSTGRRAVTTARLLASAAEVFAERGFNGASIEMICERADFTRGAFYSNFASKDELFFAMFEAHVGVLLTRLRTALELASGASDPLQHFASLVSRQSDDDRQWFLISTEFTLYAIRNPEAAAALARKDEAVRQEIGRIFTELLATAGREFIIDAALVARFAVALREGGNAQEFVEPGSLDARFVERLALPAVLDAFSREFSDSPRHSQRINRQLGARGENG
ncbi:putative TetR family transcriptional regulator [Rhodococcus wratislaviensis NBRC 100605]|uniref:Putative TetR family transcriptional regulator n=1 Tax=Rhodococcus wratislaviensis NBRC 100605 TaxID=1219028 RepID=X0QD18_RHOWR|nr:putative TetR family transcriptional regulator [Rhodococcus wratislaviensis NBRC 100605]